MSLARPKRRSWRVPAAIVLVASVANGGAALASESRATVSLDESGCASLSQPELRRFVGIELGSLLLPPAAQPALAAASDVARLSLSCDATRAVIRVRARPSASPAGADAPPTLEREVSLADFPADAAARGLTLAAIELLATLETTVRAKVAGETQLAVPPPPAPAVSWSMAVVAVRRDFLGAAGLGAWGGRIDLLRDAGRARFAGDLEVDASGSALTALGDARAVLGSVAGFAGARFVPARHVALSLSAGARAGVARMEGVPIAEAGALGRTIWRPWWGPALSARARLGGERVAALAAVELGITATGAEALSGTATVLAVRGVWLTAALGLEF